MPETPLCISQGLPDTSQITPCIYGTSAVLVLTNSTYSGISVTMNLFMVLMNLFMARSGALPTACSVKAPADERDEPDEQVACHVNRLRATGDPSRPIYPRPRCAERRGQAAHRGHPQLVSPVETTTATTTKPTIAARIAGYQKNASSRIKTAAVIPSMIGSQGTTTEAGIRPTKPPTNRIAAIAEKPTAA